MARKADIEKRLREWAEFRSARSAASDEVRDTERAIEALPEQMRATLALVYLNGGPWSDSGWPEATISRRLGRVHLMLAESLRAHQEQSQRAALQQRLRSQA